MADEIPDISPNMRKVYLRLRRWRSSHARRVPIPEPLWAAAGELAREHGINPTAKALHLEYGKLRHWAEAAGAAKKAPSANPRQARPAAAPTFMELVTPRDNRPGEELPQQAAQPLDQRGAGVSTGERLPGTPDGGGTKAPVRIDVS